ncbi:MAG: hypothetical protein PHW93_05825 [Candidatus Methanomethylophilaceae archaeon]|nr:hypothetical protein [Candidatus Methanomethylophilaceae archaeon]
MKVLFDANALMIPGQFSVDIYSGTEGLIGSFEPVTLEGVVSELEGISLGRGRDASAARVGLSLSRRCEVLKNPDNSIPVDDMILKYADENGCIVMTNDRGLRNKLLDFHIDVIVLRNQKTLEILKG